MLYNGYEDVKYLTNYSYDTALIGVTEDNRKEKECAGYIEGIGCTDEKGNHYDWKWSCLDFNHGECPMLEMLPCNGCFDNNKKGFEWRGDSQ